MDIKNNLGMYIEQLLERTNEYWNNNCLGFIEKRQIPIRIVKKLPNNLVVGKLTAKSKVDYFGWIDGLYFEIETKQTKQDFFDIHLFLQHQLNFLRQCVDWSISSYLIVYFEKWDKIFLFSFKELEKFFCSKNKKTINFTDAQKIGYELKIIFPGILNLNDYFISNNHFYFLLGENFVIVSWFAINLNYWKKDAKICAKFFYFYGNNLYLKKFLSFGLFLVQN